MSLVADPADADPTAASRPRRAALTRCLEPFAALTIGLACLAARLVNINHYTGSYPEGIRAEQLLLMAAGFHPFRDIFSDQGPWLLQTLYPGFALLGGSLAGVRSTVVLASLIGLAGIYWLVRQLAGPLGALAAVVLLALSPIYLQFSRLAVAEVLALAPAILAVACALRFAARPADRWLLLSAACLAFSLLLKPITLGAIPAVAAAIWLAGVRPLRNLALVGLVTASLVLLGVALAGLPEILQQIVQFRTASRQAEGWSAAANLRRFRTELGPEGLGLFLLAALGCVLAARRRSAWPLVIWALSSIAVIFVHSPLHSKHFAVIVVPLAALAGYGVGSAVTAFREGPLPSAPSKVIAALLVVGLLLAASSLPTTLAADRLILTSDDLFERDTARLWYDDATETLRRVVGPNEHVVTDHAYLAYAARRLTPPSLVEASATRVRAGSLTDAIAIAETRRYDTRAVLLWADKLNDLRRYRRWLTEDYDLVKIWAAEGETRPFLWLRSDAADTARQALRAGLRPLPRDAVQSTWLFVSGGLDRPSAAPGDAVSATLELESTVEAPPDARIQLTLVDAAGRVVDQEAEPLFGSAERSRWVFWVGAVSLPAGATGEHRVRAALLDPRGRSTGSPVEIGTFLAP